MVKRSCRWSLKNVEDPRTCVAPSSVSLSSNCHAGLQSQELAVLFFSPLCSSFASSCISRNPKCLEFGHGNCNPKVAEIWLTFFCWRGGIARVS